MEENNVLDTTELIKGKRGLTTIFSVIEHPPALSKCDVLIPHQEDYNLALEISARLRKAGTPVAAVDILISSIVINRDLILNTADKDFKRIQKVDSRLKIM